MLVLSHPEVRNVPGLKSPGDFLRLDGPILGGHPDRHILEVELPDLGRAYLKKEHCVRFADRVNNALHGFGFCSKSMREATMLRQLQHAGIGAPEVLAFGEDRGQAFLLLKAAADHCDLREVLHEEGRREKVLLELAIDLARMHRAGFSHGDLFAKHVLVGPGGGFVYLDWQRGRRGEDGGRRAQEDVATLLASLPGAVLDGELRESFLDVYFREREVADWGTSFERLYRRVANQPRVREQRQLAAPPARQELLWIDGERYCITPEFRDEFGESPPGWLKVPLPAKDGAQSRDIPMSLDRTATLRWQRTTRIGSWLVSLVRCRPLAAPSFLDAGAIFRLERHGLILPKVLALGRQDLKPWTIFSFLLTENATDLTPFAEYLREEPLGPARDDLLRQAEEMLRRIENARLSWTEEFFHHLAITPSGQLAIASIGGLERASGSGRRFGAWMKWLRPRPDLLSWAARQSQPKGVRA